MDLTLLAGAAAAALWLAFTRLTPAQLLWIPAGALFLSSLAFGLQGLSHGFVVLGSAMRGAGFAVIGVQSVRGLTSRAGRMLWADRGARTIVSASLVLAALLATHVTLGGTRGLAVSPWGITLGVLSVVYWLLHAAAVRSAVERSHGFGVFMACSTLAIGVAVLAVRTGIIAGNTGKFELGEGGVGLANLSTNETAAMALAPLLWTLRLSLAERVALARLGLAAVAASMLIVLASGSRISILVAVVMLGTFLLRNRGTGSGARRLTIAAAFAVTVIVGYAVVRSRTASEVDAFASGNQVNAQFALPGGERAVLWGSYLIAFAEVAASRPSALVIGVGPGGIADLYSLSALPALGITIDRASFYPVHSDLIELLLSAGGVGAVCLAIVLIGAWRLRRLPGAGPDAFRAAFLISALTTVDMLQYVPGVLSVALAAFVATLDLSRASEAASEAAA